MIKQSTLLTEPLLICESPIGQHIQFKCCKPKSTSITILADFGCKPPHSGLTEPADTPCFRVPLTYLRNTKKFVGHEVPEAPLIVFINSRSGGRAGPALTETLFHALGHSQVSNTPANMCCTAQSTSFQNISPMRLSRGDLLLGSTDMQSCGYF